MRRKDKEIVDLNVVQGILREAEVCRIAFANMDYPYIVPVNYAYQGNCLYVHSAREGKKLEMLQKNNLVCFEAETCAEVLPAKEPCQWSTRYMSVIGYGRASVIDDLTEKRMALDWIMSKYAGNGEFSYPEEALQRIVVIKVEILELSGKKSKI